MLKHKRTLAGILAATMMLSMAACGGGGSSSGGGSNADEGPQDPNAAAAAGTLELTDWEQSSGIFNTDETDEELYEKAKEEGKVTVYSISSTSPPTSCWRRSPVSTTQASTLPTLFISRTRTVRSTTSMSPPASSTTISRLTSCPISTRSTPRPRPRSTSS